MPAHPQALNSTPSDRHTAHGLSPPPDFDRRPPHPSPSKSSSHSTHDHQTKRLDAMFFSQPSTPTKFQIASQNGQPQRLSQAVTNAKHLPLRKRITKDTSQPSMPKNVLPPVSEATVPETTSSNGSLLPMTTAIANTPHQQPSPQQQQQQQQQQQKERRVSYPPTPTSSHDAKATDYYYSTKESTSSPQSENEDVIENERRKPIDSYNNNAKTSSTERRISMPLLSQPSTTTITTTTTTTTTSIIPGRTAPPPPPSAPPSSLSTTSAPSVPLSKMKPLKKVQHWISKGKMHSPTTNGQVIRNEESVKPRLPTTSRRLSWEEDDRPAPKKSKRGRPPASMTRPNSAPSWVDSSRANGRPRTGESIVAAAMAAAKGSRRNSLRQMGAKSNDDQVLYCICRKPYDVPRFMIACDRCDQWFHGECIGISEKEGEFIDLYFCAECAKATGKMTSWKPKCMNPACPKAARISSHQGRISKYCSDTCGLQVARARVELAEIKRRGHSEQSYTDMLTQRQRRARLNQLVKHDMARLSQLTEAWRRIRDQITIMDQRLRFLKLIVQHHHGEYCGLDTRLHWTDDVWQQVSEMVMDDGEIVLKFASKDVPPPPAYSICQHRPCNKHHGWRDLKLQEFEQDRHELFHSLARYAKQRRQIKDRIKRKRNTIDDEWISNATIVHKEDVIK